MNATTRISIYPSDDSNKLFVRGTVRLPDSGDIYTFEESFHVDAPLGQVFNILSQKMSRDVGAAILSAGFGQ